MAAPALRLNVAGVPFELIIENTELFQRLERRYQAFLLPDLRQQLAPYTLTMKGPARVHNGQAMFATQDAATSELRVVSEGESAPWAVLNPKQRSGTTAEHASMGAVDVMIRAMVTLDAVSAGGCCLHGAAVDVDGKGHVFVGPSGAGKSSVAAQLGSEGATILADEMVVIRPDGTGKWWAHGTPFWVGAPKASRVAACWKLSKGELGVTHMRKPDVLRLLAENLSMVIKGPDGVAESLRASAALASAVESRELRWPLGAAIRERIHKMT